jgi:D-alanyl-D-alanine carboxypeptidase/Bacterial SH3 domain
MGKFAMVLSVPQLRAAWREFECAPSRLVKIPFGPDEIKVAPPTVEAWQALWKVLEAHGYNVRPGDTDSYSCRGNASGTGKSLHSFGIALDINWDSNPWIDHPGVRAVRHSDKPDQDTRARDVAAGRADTDMTAAMVADVRAIRTKAGEPVFVWGGGWNSVKDCMHFEIDVSPEDLAVGIDWSTVRAGAPVPDPNAVTPAAQPHRVIARNGVNLREGPGATFAVITTLPFGTTVHVMRREGDWALSDLQGDGRADGHTHKAFLEAL